MLKTIVTLYDEAQKAIADSPADKKVTWSYIKTTLAPTIQKVQEGKFVDPKLPNVQIKEHYDQLTAEIISAFQSLLDV